MGGDNAVCPLSDLGLSFNPRPRMGGDAGDGNRRKTLRVSIHAPAWGATDCDLSGLAVDLRFNPRPRMGGDA